MVGMLVLTQESGKEEAKGIEKKATTENHL